MVKWLAVLSLALKLALWVLEYLERRQAITEGEKKALDAFKRKSDEIIRSAFDGRASVDHTPDAVLRDEYNLDGTDRSERKEGGM